MTEKQNRHALLSRGRGRKVVIGIDEAGYGPNLGPMLIAGSVWAIPAEMDEADLMDGLSVGFRPTAWKPQCDYVPLGDSKQLYQPKQSLTSLEAGIFSLFQPAERLGGDAFGHVTNLGKPSTEPANLLDLLSQVAGTFDATAGMPWYREACELRVLGDELDAAERQRLRDMANSSCRALDVELLELEALIISESEFNRRVGQLGSKGLMLSQLSLYLAARLAKQYDCDVEVFCDRQGGRKNYLSLLADAMPDRWFREVSIEAARSSYESFGEAERRFHFSVQGDRFPPTALASMLAKFLREKLMEGFNQFWQAHVPGLRPTAGYPQDAKRFRREMETAAERLGIPPSVWWRVK